MQNRKVAARAKKFIALLMAGMAAIGLAIVLDQRDSIYQGASDFAAFYSAGILLREGRSAQLYQPSAVWEIQQRFARDLPMRKGPQLWIRPPFNAIFFAPLARFNYFAAYRLWLMVIVVLLIASFAMLTACERELKGEPKIWSWKMAAGLAALSAGTAPIALNLLQGQDAIVLLALLSLALLLLIFERPMFSGLVLSMGMFRFHLLGIIALVMILRRGWKFFAGFITGCSVLLAASIALVGWDNLLDYPRWLWKQSHGIQNGVSAWNYMPSLPGVLFVAIGRYDVLAVVLVLILGVAGTLFALKRAEARGTASSVWALSLGVTSALFFSFHSYSYDLVLLIIPLFFLWQHAFAASGGATAVWTRIALALFLAAPLWWFTLLRTHYFYLVGFALTLSTCMAVLCWGLEGKSGEDMVLRDLHG